MTVNRRAALRAKRLERERRRRTPVTCHVCGVIAHRKTMMKRKERWCCRSIPACTERVMSPPPPAPPWAKRRPGQAHIQIVPDFGGLGEAVAKAAESFEPFNEAFEKFGSVAKGFQPHGYLSETGIERHG